MERVGIIRLTYGTAAIILVNYRIIAGMAQQPGITRIPERLVVADGHMVRTAELVMVHATIHLLEHTHAVRQHMVHMVAAVMRKHTIHGPERPPKHARELTTTHPGELLLCVVVMI